MVSFKVDKKRIMAIVIMLKLLHLYIKLNYIIFDIWWCWFTLLIASYITVTPIICPWIAAFVPVKIWLNHTANKAELNKYSMYPTYHRWMTFKCLSPALVFQCSTHLLGCYILDNLTKTCLNWSRIQKKLSFIIHLFSIQLIAVVFKY